MPSTFAQLIADPDAKKIFLLEAAAFDLLTRTTTTLYFGSECYITKASEAPASTEYVAGLMAAPWLERNLFGRNGRLGGRAEISTGEIALHNIAGDFDGLTRYAFDGRAFTLYIGGETTRGVPWARADFEPILTGLMGAHVVALDRVTIQTRDARADLNVPLIRSFYKGLATCLSFDGVNDRAVSASSFAPATSLTFEMRFRMIDGNTAAGAQTIAYHGSGATSSTADFFVHVSTAGVLTVDVCRRSGSVVTLTDTHGDVRDGVWRHLALVIDVAPNLTRLYIDGVQVDSDTPPALTSAACELGIGALFGGANYSRAELDEVRYWSTVRTAKEIADNAERTVDPASSGLTHYYRLDEGTGGTAFDQVTASPINLTITGASWASTYEGKSDLAGKTKPRSVGPCDGVEGIRVDPQLNVWQFNNGRIRKFRTVYWNGVARAENTDYTVDLSRGCITALVAVDGVVTADIDGEAEGGYIETAPDILRRLFTDYRPLTGDCLSFDGVNDDVTASVTCPAGSMTVEAWIYTTGVHATQNEVCGWRNGTSAGNRLIDTGGAGAGLVRVAVRNDAATQYTITSTARISPNAWHHVAAVLDTSGNELRLYVDGASAATPTAIAGAWTTVLSSFVVGKLPDAASTYFAGRIDEVRIWNVARTATEIRDDMSVEMAGTESGLVQCWHYNDGTGSSATNAVSGGATGTVTGATWITSADSSVTVAAAPHDFDTLETLSSAAVAHHWSGEQTTLLDAISEVSDGPGFFHSYERGGALRVGRVEVASFQSAVGAGLRTCRFGASALYATGTGSIGRVAAAAGIASGARFTFEAWIRPDRVDGERMIASQREITYSGGGVYTMGDGWWLKIDDGVIGAYGSDGTTTVSVVDTAAIQAKTWHHVALTVVYGTIDKTKLYVDGELVATGYLPLTYMASTTQDLWLGSLAGRGEFGHFQGVMDEVRFWTNPRQAVNIARDRDRELSATQVEASTESGLICSLLGYWKLNEGTDIISASAVDGLQITVYDASWCRPVAAVIEAPDFADAPTILPTDIPHALIRVGWGHNFRVLTDSDLATSVTEARRAYLAEEVRWATYDSAECREAHPQTSDLEAVPAHFELETAAKAEALRLSGLYGVEREGAALPAWGVFATLDPGDAVRLVYSRRGATYGTDYLVLGVRDEPSTGDRLVTTLQLWQ